MDHGGDYDEDLSDVRERLEFPRDSGPQSVEEFVRGVCAIVPDGPATMSPVGSATGSARPSAETAGTAAETAEGSAAGTFTDSWAAELFADLQLAVLLRRVLDEVSALKTGGVTIIVGGSPLAKCARQVTNCINDLSAFRVDNPQWDAL